MTDTHVIRSVRQGKTQEVRTLLAGGLDPNSKDDAGARLIHVAARLNRAGVVRALLGAGANVDALDPGRQTALSGVVSQSRSKNGEIALALVEGGARLDCKQSPRAQSPLHWATDKDWLEVVAAMVKRGANASDQTNTGGNAPLHLARSAAVARTLIDGGADVDAINAAGVDVLRAKLNTRHEFLEGRDASADALFRVLLESGANLSRPSPDRGHPALFDAIACGAVGLAQMMMDHGAALNFVADDGLTVIHLGAGHDDETFFAVLLDTGMDPNCVHHNSGYTPLHYAVTNRCSANVRLLLACGADPHRPDASGETPTNYADPTRWGEGAMAREHPIRVALGV